MTVLKILAILFSLVWYLVVDFCFLLCFICYFGYVLFYLLYYVFLIMLFVI